MIYKGSRYTKTYVYNRGEVSIFKIRHLNKFNTDNSKVHVLVDGETLDGIADIYYGDSQLWWVIIEANPKYHSPTSLKPGDELIIPSFEEVVSKYE